MHSFKININIIITLVVVSPEDNLYVTRIYKLFFLSLERIYHTMIYSYDQNFKLISSYLW